MSPDRLNGKEGVPLEDAYKFLEERTWIPWCDQVLLLLQAYGQKLPSRYVLSGITSAEDINRNSMQVSAELQSGMQISLTKTNFMYLCQTAAIYQSEEMKGKTLNQLVDIRKFKKDFRRVPLLDLTY